MGETNIEWTSTVGKDGVTRKGFSFNPWIGCQKVSPACDNCYAEAMMADRYGRVEWGPHGARSRTSPAYWRKPLAWNRAAEGAEERPRVFCASLADVFDNHRSILPEWRADLWALIHATPNLDWLLLTKRPQNIAKMLPESWGAGWPNVWLGVSTENQDEADRRIPILLETPAAVRFLSAEPLLGPVDLHDYLVRAQNGFCPMLDLVIVGGETGRGARPMHPSWARSLRDQCAGAGTAYFFKQWGDFHPADQVSNREQILAKGDAGTALRSGAAVDLGDQWTWRIGKAAAGRLLDGREHNDMPGARA